MKRFTAFLLIILTLSASLHAIDPWKRDIHYTGSVEAGTMFPWGQWGNSSIGMQVMTTHGVTLTPALSVGLGTGFWLNYENRPDLWYGRVPFYADARLTLPSTKWRPFFDFKAGGYIGSDPLGGFILPSVGIKYAWSKRAGIAITLGSNLYLHRNAYWDGLRTSIQFDF